MGKKRATPSDQAAELKSQTEGQPAPQPTTATTAWCYEDLAWIPESYNLLLWVFTVRVVSAVINIISDCDETFNYWEPTHFTMFGTGLQTWEYSPDYALRSYVYIALHQFIGQVIRLFVTHKIMIFYLIRMALGAVSTGCEFFFLRCVERRFGRNVAAYTLGFLALSAGMFSASTAYVPSTFAMYCMMIAFGGWFVGKPRLAVFFTALAVLLGWPFAGLAGLPIFIQLLLQFGLTSTLVWSVSSGLAIVLPMLLFDFLHYHKLVLAPLNILIYNVFGSGDGAELYGTEGPRFYLMNCFLNFNIAFPLALAAFILVPLLQVRIARCSFPSTLVFLSPMYLWLAFFSAIPHKEERFMFVVYPLICLAAGVSLNALLVRFNFLTVSAEQRKSAWVGGRCAITWLLWATVVSVFILLSVSRVAMLRTGYQAPFATFHFLQNELKTRADQDINVCMGKEWHRFPSHFFLQDPRHRLAFIESGFKGQLPQPYNGSTWVVQPHFNDRNAEEPSRYINISACHYLVDATYPNQQEPDYRELASNTTTPKGTWKQLFSVPLLDAERSPPIVRSFYIPSVSLVSNKFVDFYLLRNEARLPPKRGSKTKM